jgi:hypothetical protein
MKVLSIHGSNYREVIKLSTIYHFNDIDKLNLSNAEAKFYKQLYLFQLSKYDFIGYYNFNTA